VPGAALVAAAEKESDGDRAAVAAGLELAATREGGGAAAPVA
jgi:hypothetical protein